MKNDLLEQLKYPIGKFDWETERSAEVLAASIDKIESLPAELEKLVVPLPTAVLKKRYRPEGWTIAQVVHHLADSHMHSYLRFKHALLEKKPSIKDYQEAEWAKLPDASNIQIDYSLHLIKALHYRWVLLLKSLKPVDFQRSYFHPERNKEYPLDITLMIYAWHGVHHLAHIKNAIKNNF